MVAAPPSGPRALAISGARPVRSSALKSELCRVWATLPRAMTDIQRFTNLLTERLSPPPVRKRLTPFLASVQDKVLLCATEFC